MPSPEPRIPPRTGPLAAWFAPLETRRRPLLASGRFRIVALSLALLALMSLHLAGAVFADGALGQWLATRQAALAAIGIVLLLALFWQTWRELLLPLLRLCDWADLMRGVNLDASIELPRDSDFTELADDINMLGRMINQLSRDTEIQLQKHTDYISRESRSLAILYDVASSINESRDLGELFEKSLRSLCNNLNASAGIVRQFKGRNKRDIVASVGNLNGTFLANSDRFLSVRFPFDDVPLDRIYRVDRLDYATAFGPDATRGDGQLQVLSILLQYRSGVLGAIHLFFTDDRQLDIGGYTELLLSIGQHLGSAVEKFRLAEEESELLVMQERTRISHELHDSLAQTIASLRIQIRVIDETFHSKDESAIWHQMERIEYTIDQANTQLRELIAHFRAPINEEGLIASIEEAIRREKTDANIPIYFQNEWPRDNFPADVELNVLRIVQESLANIRKHSEAESVRVLLTYRGGIFNLLIEDDGVGFDESEIVSDGRQHLGLGILRDRAAEIDAEIDIESEPGDGTRIHLQFTVGDAEQAPLQSAGGQ